jgi:CheY-like chemotaxis protein
VSDQKAWGFGLDPKRERQIEKNLTEVIRLVALKPDGQQVIDLVRETRDLVRQTRSRSGTDDTDLADGEPAMSEEPGPADIAWQNAVTGRYDILLLDLRLPTFDSFELLDCLATIDSPTRPIALAGFLPEMIRADLRDHGCRHFVEKPFKSADLIHEIDSCALSPA